ncbi:hypothetical protein SLEP1_g35917 [Rubroshorea leprosula]|uniref:Exostosin GT47 domain-containing protein n=1 Tax=Rubroshorea leprosula TaxID=152421 RepID=A0AAV5KQ28_9ROSI|nr:hypothetical protein SLEP1_g35917 [Rubroshorea leprosula]
MPMPEIVREVYAHFRDAYDRLRLPPVTFRPSFLRFLFFVFLCVIKTIFLVQFFCAEIDVSMCIFDPPFFRPPHLKGRHCPDEESCFFLDIGFKKKYADMMREFKVFVYPEGDPRTYFHTPKKLIRLYASEAYFFRNMEQSPLRTLNPNQAHMFFIPISIQKMSEKRLSVEHMRTVVEKYIRRISLKYPYWNRTHGADHFFVSCHQMALKVTQGVPDLVNRAIRVVCDPEYIDGYVKEKDLVLPHILLPFEHPAAGNDIKKRTRLVLLGDVAISEDIGLWNGTESEFSTIKNHTVSLLRERTRAYRNIAPRTLDYNTSKFCLCPGGSQTGAGRIADAIHYGCVPVVWPDQYELPFSSMMNWSAFSVQMKQDDYLAYDVLQFLEEITEAEYRNLQENTMKVQKYFQWNSPPIKYDAFHLTMYQLWQSLGLHASDSKISMALTDF